MNTIQPLKDFAQSSRDILGQVYRALQLNRDVSVYVQPVNECLQRALDRFSVYKVLKSGHERECLCSCNGRCCKYHESDSDDERVELDVKYRIDLSTDAGWSLQFSELDRESGSIYDLSRYEDKYDQILDALENTADVFSAVVRIDPQSSLIQELKYVQKRISGEAVEYIESIVEDVQDLPAGNSFLMFDFCVKFNAAYGCLLSPCNQTEYECRPDCKQSIDTACQACKEHYEQLIRADMALNDVDAQKYIQSLKGKVFKSDVDVLIRFD